MRTRCIRVNERVICCDVCDAWFYINCTRINCSFSCFEDSTVSWIGEGCDTPNFSQTIFSPTFTVHSYNCFSQISDHLGEPVACSSPVSIANSGLLGSNTNTSSFGALKVLADVDIFIAYETKIDNAVQQHDQSKF